MKKILLTGSAVALLLPGLALAAYNDVTLTTSVDLTSGSGTIDVSGTSATVESITVSASSIQFTLQPSSTIRLSSADLYKFSSNTATDISADICSSSQSVLEYIGTAARTVTVTVGPGLCSTAGGGSQASETPTPTPTPSSGGGGGGGGGGGTTTTTTTTTTPEPTTTTTSAPTTSYGAPVAGLTEAQVQSILTLLASFNADQSVIDKVNASLHVGGVTGAGAVSSGTFTRDLETGVTGEDVRALQQYLNAHGFTVAESGPGSPDNETDRFGALTRGALAKLQAANGITPSVGYFGPKTRAFVSANP